MRHLLIMVNDEGFDDLVAYCRDLSPYIHVLGGRGNLGVAGGRNFLIRHGVAAGFDFFISCDNDIILEKNYFSKIEEQYQQVRREDPRIGLVQPVLLDGRAVRDLLGIESVSGWNELVDCSPLSAGFLADPWRKLRTSKGVEFAAGAVFHAGISNPWLAHFHGHMPGAATDLPWGGEHEHEFQTALPMLRHSSELTANVIGRGVPVKVFTVAGGITAFHKDVLACAGDYNEKFNPFGYEDSELGFRATRLGRNNYLLPGVFAIHDPFMGIRNRDLASHATIARLRAVEAMDLAADDTRRGFALAQSLFFGWSGHNSQFKSAIAAGELARDEARQASMGFFANYILNFLYGIFGIPRVDGAKDLHLFDHFLPDDFKECGKQDVVLELGRGGRVCASDVSIEHCIGSDGQRILSMNAKNCRIEESVREGEPAVSRYCDIYLILGEVGKDRFEMRINAQANERTFAMKLDADFAASLASGFREPPVISVQDYKFNAYDLGRFSAEEIYPAPTFHRSEKWLPELTALAASIRAGGSTFSWLIDPLVRFLGDKPERSPADVPSPTTLATIAASPLRKKKVLVFTDSRGQHKPAGQDHLMFGDLLKQHEQLEVDLFLCPMKWTTTLDFLELFDDSQLGSYDAIILWTGIVDWSPRPVGSARNDLYDNQNTLNLANAGLNTRDYSKKIINNKKKIFDSVFGERRMVEHLSNPSETIYAGEKTSNMYSLDMASDCLLPKLEKLGKKLVFINSNRFVPGWEGDFKKGRPANIGITHQFSDLFTERLIGTGHVVDLRKWSDEEVQRYTCDNLHITGFGNDYIYGELLSMLVDMDVLPATSAIPDDNKPQEPMPQVARSLGASFIAPTNPERIVGAKQAKILQSVGAGRYLATLIIGVRLKPGDEVRQRNFQFVLEWLEYYYSGLFEILIVEQDVEPRLDAGTLPVGAHVRYEFIYNPGDYNRGWGYNVAVKHFCQDSKVVVLMDTDVLTGGNFVREVMDCHLKYDAVSPYQNIYYSTADDVESIYNSKRVDHLADQKCVKNPVTISGGIIVIRRDSFLALKGFEQYVGYGCEDRALDVTLINHLPDTRLRIAPASYVHLFHKRDPDGRDRFDEIYGHLVANYGCRYEKGLGTFDYIHKLCRHARPMATLDLMRRRAENFGDPDLYRRGDMLAANGVRNRAPNVTGRPGAIYPPEFSSLSDYKERELYGSAPDPDSRELSTFYNAYKGRRCFIIGNGPSLNRHDLSLLKDEYTFGVNSFYYKTRESGFTPFFYVVEDSSVMKENIEEIRNYDAPFKFFPTNYKQLHPKQPNTFFFRMNRGFYEKSSPNFVVPRFSTDASDVLYCGQSVTYINLQLAYFMGFEEVYLIGMDFSYIIPESHSRKGDVLLSDTDDPNHFHKDYFGKGKTWKDPKLDRVALNYRMAKLAFEATGRRVFNATIGGNLEVFDRVDYLSLFPGVAVAGGSQDAASFQDANLMFQQGEYSRALSAYVHLARMPGGFPLYKRSAVEAYLCAREAGEACAPDDVAYVRNIVLE